MNWIEIIQLRAYSQHDRDNAVSAFYQLSSPEQEKALGNISLYRNVSLHYDLSIFIHWRGRVPQWEKTPLGLQLAAAFSEFGQINHFLLVHEGSVPQEANRTHHEKHG